MVGKKITDILRKGKEVFKKPQESEVLAREVLEDTQKILDEGATKIVKDGEKIPVVPSPIKIPEKELGTKAAAAEEAKKAAVQKEEVISKKQPFTPKAKPGVADEYLEAYNNPKQAEIIEDLFDINKIKGPEDIRQGMIRLAKFFEKEIKTQKRDVVTNKQTLEEAEQIFEKDPEALAAHILGLNPGDTLNATNLQAATTLIKSQQKKLDLLAEKAADTGATKDLIAYRQQLAFHGELMKNFLGVRTETGRALQQFTKAASDVDLDLNLDKVRQNQLLMELGGADEIKALIKAQKNLKTPGKVNKFAQNLGDKTILGKVNDAISEAIINLFLTNPYTLFKNTAGNWVAHAMIVSERRRAAKFLRDGLPGEDAVRKHEDMAMSFGVWQANLEMWKAFAKSATRENLSLGKKSFGLNFPESDIKIGKIELRNDNAFSSEAFGVSTNTKLQKGLANVVDTIGTIFTVGRIPTRFLNSTDAFFKNRMYRAELYALAFRDGMDKFEKGLLKKDKIAQYIASRITDPSKSMREAATEAAKYATFTQKLGTQKNMFHSVGKGLSTIKRDFFGWIGTYYLPFVQTPVNVSTFSLERFPAMNRLLANHKLDLSGNNGKAAQQIALAKMETGRMFFMVFAPLGYLGYFAGSDPELGMGKKKREMQKAKNYQPKSFRIPTGEGKELQINISGNDPIALMAAMAADTGVLFGQLAKDHDEMEDYLELAVGLTLVIGENIMTSNNMAGAAKFVDHVSYVYESNDKLKSLGKVGKQISSDILNPPGLRQIGKLLPGSSEFQQIKTEWGEYMKSNLLESDMYDDYDFLGEKYSKWGVFSSIKNSEILDELERLQVRITPMKATYTKSNIYPGVDATVNLTSEQFAYTKKLAGDITKTELTKLFKGQGPYANVYKNAKLEIQKTALVKDIVRKAREQAKQNMAAFYSKELQDKLIEAANEKIISKQRSIPIEGLEGLTP